jgi:DNA repair exonuclease SbcCD ATPase subunit
MSSSTNICTICLDPLVRQDCSIVTTIPCGHAYHEDCLKAWATERLSEEDPEILCPICNTTVKNVCKLFLSTKSGFDDSLSGKELESWRKEYDVEAKGERLKLHAKVLESNKKTIDEIFEKQKIMETYERDRKALEEAKSENRHLRKELFDAIMNHEAELRRMQANKQVIQEVLERNEKALLELKSTREENLDLKRELLRNIMNKQADMKKLAESKQAVSTALENQEAALNELKKSREENLSLKRELVEHLQNHKMKMEQLQTHKQSLQEIVVQHQRNISQLEEIRRENMNLKEELLHCMVLHKKDATKLARCEGWVEVLKVEVESFKEERAFIRKENRRLGATVQEAHNLWVEARRELNCQIHVSAMQKMHILVVLGQAGILGFAIARLKR